MALWLCLALVKDAVSTQSFPSLTRCNIPAFVAPAFLTGAARGSGLDDPAADTARFLAAGFDGSGDCSGSEKPDSSSVAVFPLPLGCELNLGVGLVLGLASCSGSKLLPLSLSLSLSGRTRFLR